MKILVACEESQVVTKAFRELGHEAYSCDIITCSGGHPEWHICSDVIQVINPLNFFFNAQNGDLIEIKKWDMIIAFPPCTDLSAAGAPSWKVKQKDGRQQKAIDFVLKIYNTDCDFIAIENPTGRLNTVWRKPDQIINPFQFGDPYKKRTCLWLKGLPKLIETNVVKPEFHYTSNSTRGGLLKNGTRKKSELPIRKAWDSGFERSKSFTGIAEAMAAQWSSLVL